MLSAIVISPEIEKKIAQPDHGCVTPRQVSDCFENWDGRLCYDRRAEHLDEHGNPTPWFLAETNQRQLLKIMYVSRDGKIFLKSAYPATAEVQRIFDKYAR